MAFLLIQSGDLKDKRYELDRDEVTLGRATDNVIQIPSGAVSSHHLKILRDGKKHTIVDMDSTNGTGLNGVAVTRARLKPKDIVSVGGIEVLFDGDDVDVEPAFTATAPDPSKTVRLTTFDHSAADGPPPSFGARRSNRHVWLGVTIAVSVVAAVFLIYFLFRLFKASAGG
ncbi:MAG: FHA domain-containing protein [Verrucomicrobiota bacterium]|nr:FHA domain-containing protein [Verrucomicrobiota bacterium]